MTDATMRHVVRAARESDVPLLLALIRELAEYEKLGHHVVADETLLRRNLFGERAYAEALIAETPLDGGPPATLGFALWFHNFSTFLARPGLYLEDLYVRPVARGQGIGRSLLAHLARIAVERDCGRLEWWVLDWNESAIGFYRRIGAEPMDDWTVYRVSDEALTRLADTASRTG